MSTAVENVTQLILRERQCRDRGWWDQMADCFTDGSTIDLSWFTGSGAAFVAASRGMSGRGDYAVHRLSPPFVRVRGDRALAELPVIIEFVVEIGEVEAVLASKARSQYRAERGDGIWRIARITAIYERDSLTPSVPGTWLDLDPQAFMGYRPSYRCLAWYLNQKGYHVGPDLLGDDSPQAAAGHYEAEAAWLAGSE